MTDRPGLLAPLMARGSQTPVIVAARWSVLVAGPQDLRGPRTGGSPGPPSHHGHGPHGGRPEGAPNESVRTTGTQGVQVWCSPHKGQRSLSAAALSTCYGPRKGPKIDDLLCSSGPFIRWVYVLNNEIN